MPTALNRAGASSRRQAPLTNILSMAAEDMLADATWQNISWRTGTKGKLEARFATVRVRAADGPPQRIRDKGQQHLPGDRLGSSANTAVRVLSGESPAGFRCNGDYVMTGNDLRPRTTGAARHRSS
jgi:hypothetical protein